MSVEILESLSNEVEISSESLTGMTLPLILTGLIFAFIAFFGFRFLKIEICILGALVGYVIGSVEIGALLGDSVHNSVVIIISIALAVVGVLISAKIYKIMVFIYVAIGAYASGDVIFALFINNLFESNANGTIITVLSILFAIVIAYIFCKFFKPLFILSSAFGGMVMSLTAFALVIAPENDTFLGIMMIIGLVIGLFAAIKQCKSCKELEF